MLCCYVIRLNLLCKYTRLIGEECIRQLERSTKDLENKLAKQQSEAADAVSIWEQRYCEKEILINQLNQEIFDIHSKSEAAVMQWKGAK